MHLTNYHPSGERREICPHYILPLSSASLPTLLPPRPSSKTYSADGNPRAWTYHKATSVCSASLAMTLATSALSSSRDIVVTTFTCAIPHSAAGPSITTLHSPPFDNDSHRHKLVAFARSVCAQAVQTQAGSAAEKSGENRILRR
eukprot:1180609-Prorocentrum_minimum.AAC.4